MKQSQQPMYSVFTLPGVGNKKSIDGIGVKTSFSGETNGGSKKVRRSFKQPSEEDKIVELSNKNFTVQSKKKMRWVVNMYCDWRANRLNVADEGVPTRNIKSEFKCLVHIQKRVICVTLFLVSSGK